PRPIDRSGSVDVCTRNVRIGNYIENVRCNRVPSITRNHPLASQVATELGPSRTERVHNWSVEQPRFLHCGGYDPRKRHAFPLSETFVIGKPESSIVY